MASSAVPENPRCLAQALSWRRVRCPLGVAVLLGLILSRGWKGSYAVLYGRLFFIAMVGVLFFGVLERWPVRLPSWLARWVLQVAGVTLMMPIAAWTIYLFTTLTDAVPLWLNHELLQGFGTMAFLGVLVAPWMTVSALFGEVTGAVRNQALAFELERSELERKALDARLRLLQAQVEPHFLFNTLANIRELVDLGSPQASAVLGNLIAYLRAAVPRLHESVTTMGQELELVRAYLEVMHMRIPDRLQFTLYADESALKLHCPPMALLTLVENAVRHGIDPSEGGGRIEVRVVVRDGRCRAQVFDTGVGLRNAGDGLRTGLSNLRERLQLTFGDDAQLKLSPLVPLGVCAEMVFPAIEGST